MTSTVRIKVTQLMNEATGIRVTNFNGDVILLQEGDDMEFTTCHDDLAITAIEEMPKFAEGPDPEEKEDGRPEYEEESYHPMEFERNPSSIHGVALYHLHDDVIRKRIERAKAEYKEIMKIHEEMKYLREKRNKHYRNLDKLNKGESLDRDFARDDERIPSDEEFKNL